MARGCPSRILSVLGRSICFSLLLVPAVHSERVVHDAQPIREVLGGASAGGFYQLLGETIAEMVRREYPGSSIAYEPGSQAGQLVRLINGEINLALQSPFELSYALEGRAPFDRTYKSDDFVIIARVVDHQNTMVYARKEFTERYQIKTVDDIGVRKPPLRVSFYQRGNLFADALIVRGIFGRAGIDEKSVEAWGGQIYYAPSQEAARLMADRKLDLAGSASWHPDAGTLQVARAVDLIALPAAREVIDSIARAYGLETTVIPVSAYDFMTEDYYTVSVPSYLVASPKLEEAQAYKLAKALYEQFDYYKVAHRVFATFDREMLAKSSGFRIHPGAARFYREVGLVQE